MKKCISLLTTLVLILVGCGSMASCATKGTGTFTQGFWRGQDPRASYDPKTGYYYYVEDASAGMVMFRSKSLIERGDAENRRVMPTGFPLCAPVYVEKMNGVTYNKWFAFGSSAWQCDGDPFTGKWQNIGSFGLKGWTLDHFAFRVESGAHAGEWYLIWAAGEDLNNTTGFSAEHLHISKMLAPNKVQSNKSDASDLFLRCQKGSGWSGWDVEAPTVAQKNGTVTVIYSGTDCKMNAYAMGLLVYNGEGDIADASSWTNLSAVRPAFSQTKNSDVYGTPYGTGVASVIPSADGKETWMYYNAKLYHDIPSSFSKNREAWTRIINLKKIEWTTTTINGKTATIPNLGTPDMMGATVALPSGDPGIAKKGYFLFEAEHAVPFGWIYNKTLQSKSGDDGEPYNLMLEEQRRRNPSLGACMKHFDWFAEDPNGDGTSGLHFRNVPKAKSMVIRAGTNDPNGGFDILVNGVKKTSVKFKQNLKANGQPDSSYIFSDYRVKVDIPAGATVTLQYVKGKYDDSAVDFVVFENTKEYDGFTPFGSTVKTTAKTTAGNSGNNSGNNSGTTAAVKTKNGAVTPNGSAGTVGTADAALTDPTNEDGTVPTADTAGDIDTDATAPTAPADAGGTSALPIIVGILAVIVLLFCGGSVGYFLWKKKKMQG